MYVLRIMHTCTVKNRLCVAVTKFCEMCGFLYIDRLQCPLNVRWKFEYVTVAGRITEQWAQNTLPNRISPLLQACLANGLNFKGTVAWDGLLIISWEKFRKISKIKLKISRHCPFTLPRVFNRSHYEHSSTPSLAAIHPVGRSYQ